MSAKQTIKSIKAGQFVPFPHLTVSSDLRIQLLEVSQALPSEAMADLLYCLVTKSTDLPPSLVRSEHRFFTQIIKQGD